MSSPISFSGFNKIDFNQVLNAIMAQEREPIRAIETQQRTLQARVGAFSTLSSKVAALEASVASLAAGDAVGSKSATVTPTGAFAVTAKATAPAGIYDVVVTELARAQVTAAVSVTADKDTTIVASGGTLTIGGVAVTVSGDVTLEGLADAINSTSGIGVSAIAASVPGGYQLILTGSQTGAAQAYTITNALTGGAGIQFGDADVDGISGDSAADNAISATDASLLVNNVTMSSPTNTVDGVIAGATLTLFKKDPTASATVTISENSVSMKASIEQFVETYNEILAFVKTQTGVDGIGRDPVLRGLQSSLSSLVSLHLPVGGAYDSLAQIGLGFSRSGELTLDAVQLDAAIEANAADVKTLVAGASGVDGVFDAIKSAVKEYTQAGGMLPDAQTRLNDQLRAAGTRIGDLEARLALRRAALQKEFIAADMAIAQLNNSIGSLSSLGSLF